MQAPKFWYSNSKSKFNFWAFILLPISFIIYFFSKFRFCFKPAYTGRTPIICIGNITAGGTGKTPTAILVAQIAQSLDLKVAFLSKGYGGSFKEPWRVNNDNNPYQVGDEPLILNIHAPCFIAKNRIAGAIYIDALKEFDLIITDDGLQNHPSLYKQCAILTIDKKRLFGNNYLIPSGPLREPLSSALKKATFIFLIGSENCSTLPNNLATIKQPIIHAYKKPINHGETLIGQNVIAFSGLGNNQQFFDSLKSVGAHIIYAQEFPDHFQYSDKIIERLIKKANQSDALLVTTEKDMIKINKKFYSFIMPFVIELDICDSDREIIENKILELVNQQR